MSNERYLYFLLALLVLQWVFRKLSEYAARRVAASQRAPLATSARRSQEDLRDDEDDRRVDFDELERNEELVRRDTSRPTIQLPQVSEEAGTNAEKIRAFLQQLANQSNPPVPRVVRPVAAPQPQREPAKERVETATAVSLVSQLAAPSTTAYDIDTAAYLLKSEQKPASSLERFDAASPFSRQRLRDAFVWSEILSTPVGWR
ncbi:MAG: hypothetical protein ACKVX7_02850 [Planctomycetota bacterium]